MRYRLLSLLLIISLLFTLTSCDFLDKLIPSKTEESSSTEDTTDPIDPVITNTANLSGLDYELVLRQYEGKSGLSILSPYEMREQANTPTVMSLEHRSPGKYISLTINFTHYTEADMNKLVSSEALFIEEVLNNKAKVDAKFGVINNIIFYTYNSGNAQSPEYTVVALSYVNNAVIKTVTVSSIDYFTLPALSAFQNKPQEASKYILITAEIHDVKFGDVHVLQPKVSELAWRSDNQTDSLLSSITKTGSTTLSYMDEKPGGLEEALWVNEDETDYILKDGTRITFILSNGKYHVITSKGTPDTYYNSTLQLLEDSNLVPAFFDPSAKTLEDVDKGENKIGIPVEFNTIRFTLPDMEEELLPETDTVDYIYMRMTFSKQDYLYVQTTTKALTSNYIMSKYKDIKEVSERDGFFSATSKDGVLYIFKYISYDNVPYIVMATGEKSLSLLNTAEQSKEYVPLGVRGYERITMEKAFMYVPSTVDKSLEFADGSKITVTDDESTSQQLKFLKEDENVLRLEDDLFLYEGNLIREITLEKRSMFDANGKDAIISLVTLGVK